MLLPPRLRSLLGGGGAPGGRAAEQPAASESEEEEEEEEEEMEEVVMASDDDYTSAEASAMVDDDDDDEGEEGEEGDGASGAPVRPASASPRPAPPPTRTAGYDGTPFGFRFALSPREAKMNDVLTEDARRKLYADAGKPGGEAAVCAAIRSQPRPRRGAKRFTWRRRGRGARRSTRCSSA